MALQDVIDAKEAAENGNHQSAAQLARNALEDVRDFSDLSEDSVAFDKMESYVEELERQGRKAGEIGETANESQVQYALSELQKLIEDYA